MFDSTDYCICEIVVLEFYLQKRTSLQWHKQAVTDAIMLSGIYLKIILKLFEYVVDMKQTAYDWQLWRLGDEYIGYYTLVMFVHGRNFQ